MLGPFDTGSPKESRFKGRDAALLPGNKNSSVRFLCVCVCPPLVVRQRVPQSVAWSSAFYQVRASMLVKFLEQVFDPANLDVCVSVDGDGGSIAVKGGGRKMRSKYFAGTVDYGVRVCGEGDLEVSVAAEGRLGILYFPLRVRVPPCYLRPVSAAANFAS